jgi:hypothetical protein
MKKKQLQNQSKEIIELLEKSNIYLSVGDKVIDSHDGDVFTVAKFTKEGIELTHKWNNEGEESRYGTIKPEEFIHARYVKLEKSYEEYEKELSANLLNLDQYEEDKTESTSREIAPTSSKSQLISLKNTVEDKRRHIAILHGIIETKRNYLQNIVRDLETKLEKIYKVIDVIELYLGIYETIIQIQKGPKASDSEPITFRQAILFMDEEVGDPKDQGLDFRKIQEFDDWLLKEENYKKILPEEKCVVIMKPRRHDKDYDHWFTNVIFNIENKRTYFLIRNGMNFYRIDSNISVGNLFFPAQEEMTKMLKDYNETHWDSDKEKIEDKMLSYKRNALMMQGLLDRTEIFHPLPHVINIFDVKTYKKAIRFIRDGEMLLSSGRKSFKDWKAEINSKIKIGSRIVFSGFSRDEFSTYESSSYARRSRYYDRFPCRPEVHPGEGVYTVEGYLPYKNYKEENCNKLICKYAQGGERYSGWGYESIERKNRTAFYLYPNDYCVYNYDLLDLDDIEYYINSRIDREHYCETLPLLWEIKKQRLKELEWEKGLVARLVLEIDYDNKKKLEKIIWDCIKWWKNKVIWKRPLTKDDAKALRMIKGKINRIIKEGT